MTNIKVTRGRTPYPFLIFPLLIASIIRAPGHPGHDPFSHGFEHAFTNPYHLLTLAGLGCALFACALFVRNRGTQVAIRVAGVAAVVGALVVWMLR